MQAITLVVKRIRNVIRLSMSGAAVETGNDHTKNCDVKGRRPDSSHYTWMDGVVVFSV